MSEIFKHRIGKIKRITSLGKQSREMYDIGMKESPHTFFANNILVHNSVFFTAQPLVAENLDDMSEKQAIAKTVEVALSVQNFINQAYTVYAQRLHNCKKHYFKIKQEVVARRAFWGRVKKRYAQWLVLEEEVPVDKLDIKGMDVVRSNFPKSFRKVMRQMFVDILHDKTKDDIDDNIIGFKDQLFEKNFLDVMVPISAKKVRDYDNDERPLFKFLKGTPIHYKAALAYNDFRKLKKLFSFPPIENGDKIIWAYLKENPYGLDSIALSVEENPPEILEFVEYYIDRNKIFEQLLLGKVKEYYSNLGWGEINLSKNFNTFF